MPIDRQKECLAEHGGPLSVFSHFHEPLLTRCANRVKMLSGSCFHSEALWCEDFMERRRRFGGHCAQTLETWPHRCRRWLHLRRLTFARVSIKATS
jgi:hypothetical protein